jgi:MEDS: MEthanogen/methylotroph, DcmR Sensory domain
MEGCIVSAARVEQPKSAPKPARVNWLELDRSPHAVHFYSSEGFLLDSLSRFVGTALEAGDSCLILASKAHLEGLAERLSARGVDTDKAAKRGRYVTLDNSQALARVTVNGELSRALFDEFVREVVLPLEYAAEGGKVAVCGQLASLLWAGRKPEAAIELEHFWNELARLHRFRLRCFYPIASFSDPRQSELFLKLCAEHATAIPPESEFHNVAERVEQFESSPER